MRFSLIIPCFNEGKNIPILLEKCKFIKDYENIELILVDNGSTDHTQMIIKQYINEMPYCKLVCIENNLGYGYGILSGLAEAKGEILGWTHADLQTDPRDILKGLELFNRDESLHFVKGRRVNRPLKDAVFTVGMSIFESLLLFKPLFDINAQPTMFKRDLYNQLINPPFDFSLDLYLYYNALKMGYYPKKFDVNFGERAHGISNWNVNWTSKLKFIERTIKYSLKLKKDT